MLHIVFSPLTTSNLKSQQCRISILFTELPHCTLKKTIATAFIILNLSYGMIKRRGKKKKKNLDLPDNWFYFTLLKHSTLNFLLNWAHGAVACLIQYV